VPTITHLVLAAVLTLFLAFQANSLVFVLRSRRAMAGRARRRSDVLWTAIPVVVVLFLAARSWLAAFDLERPAVASAISQSETAAPASEAPPR
jgi:heme/copper-type cytochrome/quinol oxidase subunit 2